MQQLFQNLRTGVLDLTSVPCPQVADGHVLIRSRSSLISSGTERMLVEFSRASLIAKARQQPDRVQQVLDKIRSDGLLPTLEAVFARLDQPMPLGYCNAGTVVELGPGVTDFEVGQRVASNGPHAELVHVPEHLCAAVPDEVLDDHATFTVLAAVGLQGIRLLQPNLGESVAVIGLGLVGLLSVQMLIAAGVQVVGIDLDPFRLELAKKFGATTIQADQTDVVEAARSWSGGAGVDAVLITASAKNDVIVHQAAQMSRKRGRIVLVGVVNLELQRADFYEKELSFQVSCSYGPGRYDPQYEEQGIDYPYAFVRWTEQRNLQTVLQMMAREQIDVESLITRRWALADVSDAYRALTDDRTQLGMLLRYPEASSPVSHSVVIEEARDCKRENQVAIGCIGAGNFSQRVLLPQLKKLGAQLIDIASVRGVSAAHAAKKFGFSGCTSDYRSILNNDQINTVFITTRHDLHASLAVEALEAGKHVFVEKPVSIDQPGIECVREAWKNRPQLQFLVGFNRRFSPQAVKMRELLQGRVGPICATALINAGQIPADHWTQNPETGGGRVVGEVCHWIDLFRYLVGSPIIKVHTSLIDLRSGTTPCNDHVSVALNHQDGSLTTIQYFANGPRSFPKERIEVYCDQRALQLNNFRVLRGYGWKKFRTWRLFRQDKGHAAEVNQFLQAIAQGGSPLIPPEEIWNVSRATLAAQESMTTSTPVELT